MSADDRVSSAARRADVALRELTDGEKVGLLSGNNMWESGGVPRLGIPPLRMSDGPHGMRGFGLRGDAGATLTPCETALAATFNEALISEVGELLGAECAQRGGHVLLGPCLNLQRWPLSGRHFECFSEDPYLSGRAAAAYVRGVQRHVAACAKHFVCNDQEDYRHTLNSVVDERTLHEVYLAPFEAAVRESGVEAIMCGYNRLNGLFCTENVWLLQNVLREQWGFHGFVVSDWWGNRSTVPAIQAGLNIEMPGIEPRHYGSHLLDAVQRGEVPAGLLDERCRPVLETLFRHSGAPSSSPGTSPTAGSAGLLRKAASESLVLLKNKAGALPLDAASFNRIAIIGPNASDTCVQGGGSSRVRPARCTTILEALRAALPSDMTVVHEPGCHLGESRRTTPEFEALKRISGCDASGQPVGLAAPITFLPTQLFDRALTVGSWLSSKAWFVRFMMPVLRCLGMKKTDPAKMAARQARDLRRRPTRATTAALPAPSREEHRMLDSAERAAREADACILVLGTTGHWESEGMDQLHMRLLGRQDELARRVAAAARGPVIVVLNVGSPKELPWLDSVPAVLLAHFGGQEMAGAVASAILGHTCPAGRLPTTWPKQLGDSPAVAAAASDVLHGKPQPPPGETRYPEGTRVGYRGLFRDDSTPVVPLFPFGHGLSYTRFSYELLEVKLVAGCGDEGGPQASVQARVRNDGAMAGAEVAQLYVGDGRAPHALRGFRRTAVLFPGQDETVTFKLDARGLGGWYSREAAAWVPPAPGAKIRLEVGSSSADIRARATMTLA